MKIRETLLVSFNFSNSGTGVLLVGRNKPSNQTVEIVNKFQGEEALNLYKILTTVKEKENDKN